MLTWPPTGVKGPRFVTAAEDVTRNGAVAFAVAGAVTVTLVTDRSAVARTFTLKGVSEVLFARFESTTDGSVGEIRCWR